MNVGIATVVEFLQKKGYTVEANPNTKITEEQYAILVKEFSTDKNLRLESERFIQERQNKDRNKASVSIDGYEKQPEKSKADDVIKTVVPEDARPKFKPVGKIDLNKFNRKVEKEPVSESKQQSQPQTQQPAPVVTEEKKKEEATKPVVAEVKKEEIVAPVVQTEPVKEKVEPVVIEQPKPAVVEEKVVEEVKKEEPKVEVMPEVTKEEKAEPKVETPETVATEKQEEDVFKIRQPEFVSKINVIGQIDLAALNQSTRPKKKSKEEKRKEREEKEKQRQDQRKQMKDAIIKEIRKDDSKVAKSAPKENADANGKKKRIRINKEKVDVNNVASNFTHPTPNSQKPAGHGGQGGGQNRNRNNNKDRFKKPVVKQEVSEEDVAKQVKETLARLTTKGKNKASKYRKEKREMVSNRMQELENQEMEESKVLKLTEFVTANELASMMDVSVNQVIATCMSIGIMVSINQRLDAETINLVAEEFGFKTEYVSAEVAQAIVEEEDAEEDLEPRAPIVTVMGHVDHGKTSLLDYIRKANVIAGEAGGITQHIGAYHVTMEDGRKITFLDTPGHEAFTAMRARGANVTDIAILVVAADDGIMPQTIESINHAKAAGVSIIVAINKMDKEGADPDRVKQQLTEQSLVVEEWGGDVIAVPVSAKTGMGIDELLENILLVAEVKELKANPDRLARGTVVEARLDKGKGPVATLLVQNGTLKSGDVIIAGTSVGRIRTMTNDKGRSIKEAGPSTPVEITGLGEVPSAGDVFNAVADEKLARELVEQRKHEAKEEQFQQHQKVTLDNLFSQIAEGEMKELPIIVKADVQGSVEAVKQSLEKLSNDEVRVKVIHGGVGAVSESDVMLANASNAIIVGFNVRPDPVAKQNAEQSGVDIRLYRIIYDAIEEITDAMKGMLAPKYREVETARIEVRQVYKISNVGTVAGSYVLDGKVGRNNEIRVVRDGIVIAEDKMSSLKRFKDDAKEVAAGFECGITLEKFTDIKEGDIFEAFYMEEYRD